MHGNNPSVSAANGAGHGGLPKHRYSSRSNSVSGSSVGTIKRTASLSNSTSPGARNSVLPMRPQSPGDTSLIALRLGGGQVSQLNKRRKSVALDPSEQPSSEGLGNLNRWSQSTDSSATSPTNTRRNRASSGAALANQPFSPPRTARRPLIDHSPRASPQRTHLASPPAVPRSQYSPAPSPERERPQHSQSAASYGAAFGSNLPSLYTTSSRTHTNDTESPSTTHTGTPSTPGLPTPSTQSSYAQDYFGAENVSPRSTAANQRPIMGRTVTAPGAALNYSRMPRSEAVQESVHKRRQSEMIMNPENNSRPVTAILAGDSRGNERRPRTRERTERDKKAMLSKALQKANTAVLLDNAQNFEGALDAYRDACRLLQQVMDRSSGADDKRKLEAIRVTYTNRIEELQQLEDTRPLTRDEKGLPSRPMSDDSVKSPIDSPSPGNSSRRASTTIETATMGRVTDVPRLSYAARDRDSFFSRTLADVEKAGQDNDGFARGEKKPSIATETVHEEEQEPEEPPPKEQVVHLSPGGDLDPYVPAPLLPRKQPSPTFESSAERDWTHDAPESESQEQDEATRDRAESNASVSWLDTIDESGSSCGSSIHSRASNQDLHRKHLHHNSGSTVADLDAAYDAAVEAAYDEGFEPDLDGQVKHEAGISHTINESIAMPNPGVKEMLSPTAPYHGGRSLAEAMDDEEEERLLDEMTNDYGHGFNFDLQTKSALPRQSDSSGYSRSTWQSSQGGADRTTAGTSLSTVPEDLLSARFSNKHASVVSSVNTVRAEAPAPPPQWPPPTGALPEPPGSNEKRSSVRTRRLSGQNPKQLKIETSTKQEGRKRASTFHHSPIAPFEEEEQNKPGENDTKLGAPLVASVTGNAGPRMLQSPPELRSAVSQSSIPATTTSTEPRESLDEVPAELRSARPNFFRKNKSSVSLRDNLVSLPSRDDSDHTISTPLSSSFATLRHKQGNDPLTSQRANFPFHSNVSADSQYAGGAYLFDTSLSAQAMPSSPRSGAESEQPFGLEPCPEPFLLRPFWLMRAIGSTITHQRGGFLTTRLFVPREVWQTRGVKIKALDDKIANCDLLTAALGQLAGVDTYDADAIMEELQRFEEVMERVQASLVKKLGSEVGVNGAMAMFKDAPGAPTANGTGAGANENANPTTEKAAKSNSGKSYLTSWRKLRSKSSGAPLTSAGIGSKTAAGGAATEKSEPQTMASVPMTSYIPVERRGQKTGREIKGMTFEGPQKEYMGSLARLVQGVGVLDQIARQVEDPGLRHSSQTHVGLELSMRHAAEFFAFHVCRFVLADLGVLVDKFVKRGTEWALA